MSKIIIFFSFFFFVPSIVLGASTYDDTILSGVFRATSSANLVMSYTNAYDQYIYRTDETGKPTGTGFTCNGTTACGASVRAPVNGNCPTRSINTTGDQCGSLVDGFYTYFDVGSGAPDCSFASTIAQCAAGARSGKYMNFEICSDGSCLVSSTPPSGATSTTSTLETSLAYADFLIDFSGFVILLGMLLYKLS